MENLTVLEIKHLPIKYNLPDSVISKMEAEYSHLEITDSKSYKEVKQAIARVRSLRVSVEKKRKELKADALTYGRRVDAEAKRLTKLILPIENRLKEIKLAEDERRAAIKAEQEAKEKERIERIRSKINAFPPSNEQIPQLVKMTAEEIKQLQEELKYIIITPDIFEEFTEEAIKTSADKKILLQEAYTARIQADAKEAARKRAEREAEAKRIEEEKRLAAIKAEQEAAFRLAEKERKEEEARLKKIAEEQARISAEIQAEKERIEAEKQAFQRQQELIRQEEQKRIEAEKQAKLKAEQEKLKEEERKKAVELEKKRQALLRPDREQLISYCSTLRSVFDAVDKPAPKTEEGRQLLSYLTGELFSIIIYSSRKARTLGK